MLRRSLGERTRPTKPPLKGAKIVPIRVEANIAMPLITLEQSQENSPCTA
jgi:hypothetical protein